MAFGILRRGDLMPTQCVGDSAVGIQLGTPCLFDAPNHIGNLLFQAIEPTVGGSCLAGILNTGNTNSGLLPLEVNPGYAEECSVVEDPSGHSDLIQGEIRPNNPRVPGTLFRAYVFFGTPIAECFPGNWQTIGPTIAGGAVGTPTGENFSVQMGNMIVDLSTYRVDLGFLTLFNLWRFVRTASSDSGFEVITSGSLGPSGELLGSGVVAVKCPIAAIQHVPAVPPHGIDPGSPARDIVTVACGAGSLPYPCIPTELVPGGYYNEGYGIELNCE